VAYYIAIAWSTTGFGWSLWGHNYLAWPVTMISGCILTIWIGTRNVGDRAPTTIGRAISALWMTMGISMFILLLSLSLSGWFNQQAFVAIIAAMLGTTNAASSFILRWKMQFACAVVWWAAASLSCFASIAGSSIIFLVAIFFCQIVFGIYGMVNDSRRRRAAASRQGAFHA
jgi:hypothetical protein